MNVNIDLNSWTVAYLLDETEPLKAQAGLFEIEEANIQINDILADPDRSIKDAVEVGEAYRRLIEAAPDLLAALEGLEPIIQTARSNASGNPSWHWVKDRTDAARAAIAKAKGEQ